VLVGVALAAEGVVEGVPVGVIDEVTDIVGVFEGVAPNDREPVGVGVCETGVDVGDSERVGETVEVSERVGETVEVSDTVGVTDFVGVIDPVGVIEDVGEGACWNVQTRLAPKVPPDVKPSAQAHVLSAFQVEFAASQTHPPRTRSAAEPTVHVLHTVASFPLASTIE
jgi:hypothetical protein